MFSTLLTAAGSSGTSLKSPLSSERFRLSMAKILYCGDAFVETGFGRVAENLLPALAEHYEVVVMATNYHADPHDEARKYRVYPAMTHGTDPFGSHRIAEIVQKEKPDLIWVTNDFWTAINLWEQIKDLKEAKGLQSTFGSKSKT